MLSLVDVDTNTNEVRGLFVQWFCYISNRCMHVCVYVFEMCMFFVYSNVSCWSIGDFDHGKQCSAVWLCVFILHPFSIWYDFFYLNPIAIWCILYRCFVWDAWCWCCCYCSSSSLVNLNDARFNEFLYFWCYFWILQMAVRKNVNKTSD